jgi:hypothetical protein
MRTDELIQSGLSQEAARERARAEFGNERRGAVGCAAQGDRLERRRRISRFVADLKQGEPSGTGASIRTCSTA